MDRNALQQLPALAGLPPELRARLQSVPDRVAWRTLDDTLAQLEPLQPADEVIAAAVLFSAGIEPGALPEPLATLVEGQQAGERVEALHGEQGGGANPEPLRRLLLAMARDLRVVPIVLARQLARLRDAIAGDSADIGAIARVSRDIHAPLANRLGIWQLKWSLEDLAFRVLEPEAYRRIARQMDDTRSGREAHIELVKHALDEALRLHGIDAEISGRPKHLYSIWRKMQLKGLPFEALQDLRAVRVLVDDVAQCYAVLGVVHATWAPVPGAFDDYIARPKANDYRSLHTAVVGPEGKTIEVQIRTHAMHRNAELGVAAHWRYKEGGAGDAALERKVAWMRRLLEHAEEDAGAGLRAEFEGEVAEDRVYVLTPKGQVIDLPHGSTPLDFAYRVHTDVGHRCRGAKVDGRIVPLDYRLRTAERVEILTGRTGAPRRDWLLPGNRFLASGRAREKVRAWFRLQDREANRHAGRELLDRELKRMGLADADLAPVLAHFHLDHVDELHLRVALGEIGRNQVLRVLSEAQHPQEEEPLPQLATPAPPRRNDGGMRVAGIDNVLAHVANCCQPVAGEAVTGYLTRTRGLSVHRVGCAAFQRMALRDPDRVVPVDWGDATARQDVDIIVEASDRKWLVRDITNLMAQEGVNIGVIHTDSQRVGRPRIRMRLQVRDIQQLAGVLDKLATLAGVEDVRRAGGAATAPSLH